MSNAVFPTLAGLAWNIVKAPQFSTITHRSASGRETRAALMQYPLWTFTLSYEVLRQNSLFSELKTLAGFFISRRGSFDSFLYSDPTDNSVTSQLFGSGNGLLTKFQLVRTFGGFDEPVQNLNGTPTIFKNGISLTAGSDYTIDSQGAVTFTTTPSNGDVLTWTGAYYYQVRFTQDNADFNQMLKDLWDLKKLEFVGSTMDKV